MRHRLAKPVLVLRRCQALVRVLGCQALVRVLGCQVLVFAACASKPLPAPPDPPPNPGTGDVQVRVTGFENEVGQVLIALFLNDNGWPGDDTLAFGAVVLPIQNLQATADFTGVPAGPFAVSVFHDEDGDRELDTGVFGIPSEAYGFSRGARGTFGPPSFGEARLELAAAESMSITIEVE